MSTTQIALLVASCVFLAAIPAGAWWLIFYKKQREDRLHSVLTFVFGALVVLPLILYKYLWQFYPDINISVYLQQFEDVNIGILGLATISVSVIIFYIFSAVLEEVLKLSVVHAMDDKRIRHIDDAIMFAILAALGFSFAENIMYFYEAYTNNGLNNLARSFFMRSIFSMFSHVLFSSICGYYYGLGHFAKPLLQEELKRKRHPIMEWFHRIFRFKTENLFHEEKILEGLTIAVLLHVVFNLFQHVHFDYGVVPYLVFGYAYVSYLFQTKENHRRLDMLFEGERNNNSDSGAAARGISGMLFRRNNSKDSVQST